LGMYFILQGKTYDGKYVGGPTDVFIIDKNRQRQQIEIASSRVWETALETLDQEIAILFSAFTDADTFDNGRMQALSRFAGKVEMFSGQVRALKAKERTA